MSDWKTYGLCPCGYYEYAPFGNLFHIHRKVCPGCGRDIEGEWKVVTARIQYRKHNCWWKFPTPHFEIKEA